MIGSARLADICRGSAVNTENHSDRRTPRTFTEGRRELAIGGAGEHYGGVPGVGNSCRPHASSSSLSGKLLGAGILLGANLMGSGSPSERKVLQKGVKTL